jgi:hypothetical protein
VACQPGKADRLQTEALPGIDVYFFNSTGSVSIFAAGMKSSSDRPLMAAVMETLYPQYGGCTRVKCLRIILAGASRLRTYTIGAPAGFAPFHTTHSSAADGRSGVSARHCPFIVTELFSPGVDDAADPPKNVLSGSM